MIPANFLLLSFKSSKAMLPILSLKDLVVSMILISMAMYLSLVPRWISNLAFSFKIVIIGLIFLSVIDKGKLDKIFCLRAEIIIVSATLGLRGKLYSFKMDLAIETWSNLELN